MTTESPAVRAAANGSAEGSVIHDLGYRRYDGARHGASGAFHALTWQGVRALLGMGRPLKAKLIPIFVVVVSLLPSLGALVASGASGGQLALRYGQQIAPQLMMFILMAAAQAPEVLSRDQQHRVLPLYFTRDLTRDLYSAARLLALFTVMCGVCLAPLLLLYFGEIGIAKDPAATFATMRGKIGPVLALGTATAWLLATVGAAIASLTPRRAYATAGIIATFLVTSGLVAALHDVAGVPESVATVLNPLQGHRTLTLLLFGETTRAMELTPPPDVWVFLATYGAIGAVAVLVLMWRVRRMGT